MRGWFVVAMLLAGCRGVGEGQPELRLPVNPRTGSIMECLPVMKRAPVVVLGTIRSVSIAKDGHGGGEMQRMWDGVARLDYVKVEVAVETVVRGRVGGRLEYGVWCFSRRNRTTWRSGTFWPEVGQRKLFFLEQSGGGYRAVGDFLEYEVRVWTGPHGAGYCEGKEEGVCLADILLRMQEGGSLEGFLSYLVPVTAYPAGDFSSPRYAMQVLEELAQDRRANVAARARDAMDMVRVWWPELGGNRR